VGAPESISVQWKFTINVVILLILAWPSCPYWTFAPSMAFFHQFQFLDISFQFVILDFLICPETFLPSISVVLNLGCEALL
jgi:hypothetical protein